MFNTQNKIAYIGEAEERLQELFGQSEFVPRKIGNIWILGKLGSGGMGEVYYGIKTGIRGYTKRIAIKKLSAHLKPNVNAVKGFEREAKIAALITHPHIIQVHDFIKNENDYYLTMEYLEGKTLSEIGRKTRELNLKMPIEWWISIIVQVGRALSYVHELCANTGESLNIVHRDIKPANIMVSFSGYPKIVDFGISTFKYSEKLTATGLLRGTCRYLAPEQFTSNSVHSSIDVFSLALVLYEMLVGRPAYEGENDTELLTQARQGMVPPPSALIPDFDRDLEKILMQALEALPAKRTSTAIEFANQLENWLLNKLGKRILNDSQIRKHMLHLFADDLAQQQKLIQSFDSKLSLIEKSEELPPNQRPPLSPSLFKRVLGITGVLVSLVLAVFFYLRKPQLSAPPSMKMDSIPVGNQELKLFISRKTGSEAGNISLQWKDKNGKKGKYSKCRITSRRPICEPMTVKGDLPILIQLRPYKRYESDTITEITAENCRSLHERATYLPKARSCELLLNTPEVHLNIKLTKFE